MTHGQHIQANFTQFYAFWKLSLESPRLTWSCDREILLILKSIGMKKAGRIFDEVTPSLLLFFWQWMPRRTSDLRFIKKWKSDRKQTAKDSKKTAKRLQKDTINSKITSKFDFLSLTLSYIWTKCTVILLKKSQWNERIPFIKDKKMYVSFGIMQTFVC